jgi:hypothetical protein
MIKIEEYINCSRGERRKHLDLSDKCIERGGNSTNHKGVLAQYLDSNIPGGRILLCHACNNGKCSNPKHLYWGTDKDNHIDLVESGNFKSIFQRRIEKYGYDNACKQNSHLNNKGGCGNKGKRKSENTKRKISETLLNKNKNVEFNIDSSLREIFS